MKTTIEIDEKIIPEGYEIVAYRMPVAGEMILSTVDNRASKCVNSIIPMVILKRKRWRAKKNDSYYFIAHDGDITKWPDNDSEHDDTLHKIGNYFRTREDAEEKLPAFLALFGGDPCH
jgi:hypothetical protein